MWLGGVMSSTECPSSFICYTLEGDSTVLFVFAKSLKCQESVCVFKLELLQESLNWTLWWSFLCNRKLISCFSCDVLLGV